MVVKAGHQGGVLVVQPFFWIVQRGPGHLPLLEGGYDTVGEQHQVPSCESFWTIQLPRFLIYMVPIITYTYIYIYTCQQLLGGFGTNGLGSGGLPTWPPWWMQSGGNSACRKIHGETPRPCDVTWSSEDTSFRCDPSNGVRFNVPWELQLSGITSQSFRDVTYVNGKQRFMCVDVALVESSQWK